MKLGINATFLHERPTGLGVFTQELSLALSALHDDLTVFAPISVKGLPDASLFKVTSLIKGSMRFRNNLFRALYLNSVLPAQCIRKKVDVLFCPMLEFPFLPSVPMVVHLHDFHPMQFAPQFRRAAAHFRLSLRMMVRLARRVTVSSDFVKGQLTETTNFPEERIDVVPLAYSPSLFRPMDPAMKAAFLERHALTGGYVLAVGNLFPYKNIDTLVEAFLRIKDRIPHALVIVGRKEFAAGGLREYERVIYTDYVPEEDLPRFYSYADLFVHPSLSEGFGMTPLEAMACGTPVISSDGGSLPEVLGDAGIFFDPRDPGVLSELILKVLGSEALRRELSARGLERSGSFSWEKTARGLLESCGRALGAER